MKPAGLAPWLLAMALADNTSAAAPSQRLLALGDSYTIGETVSPLERWPVQLTEMLRLRGLPMADPQIVATTGWTTDELSAALDQDPPSGKFALVTLLIGVNNQYRGRSADEYRLEFRALLARAIGWTNRQQATQVIVLSIPDWGVTLFARAAQRDSQLIAEQIDQFNAINRRESEAAGAHWVDITGLTREAATDSGLLAADGLHPSAKDYARWAHKLLPIAVQILSDPKSPSTAPEHH